MIIDLTRLRSGVVKEIPIDEKISFDNLDNDIKELKDIHVVGSIYKNSLNEYILDVNIKGQAILRCAVTLKDVPYDLDLDINDNLLDLFEESSIILKNIENTIDILPIIWENILMEIPTHVVSPDASGTELEGEGWILNKEVKTGNSELSKLKDLL